MFLTEYIIKDNRHSTSSGCKTKGVETCDTKLHPWAITPSPEDADNNLYTPQSYSRQAPNAWHTSGRHNTPRVLPQTRRILTKDNLPRVTRRPRPRPSSRNTASQVPSLRHAGSSVPRQDVPHVSPRHYSNYTYLTIQIFPLHPIHLILPQLHTTLPYNSSLVLTRIHMVKIQLGNIVALLATHTQQWSPCAGPTATCTQTPSPARFEFRTLTNSICQPLHNKKKLFSIKYF